MGSCQKCPRVCTVSTQKTVYHDECKMRTNVCRSKPQIGSSIYATQCFANQKQTKGTRLQTITSNRNSSAGLVPSLVNAFCPLR